MPTINKSAWIRSQPESMSAKEVMEKAKAEGIKISLAQVYTARSNAKKAGQRAGSKPRAPAAAGAGARARSARDDELEFRRLVLSIGLARAETYLNELRRSVGL